MKGMRLFSAAASLLALTAACGDIPTRPEVIEVDGVPVVRDETNQGLTIVCDYHAIEVVESMYCRTTYNGTDVTSATNFYSMDTNVVTTGTGGYVDAVAPGGTLIWGSWNGITVSWDITVFDLTTPVTTDKSYAYNEYATWTATPSHAGSYYYYWEYKWCYNGTAPGDCDGQWHYKTSGQDVTSATTYVHNEDYYVSMRVFVSRVSGGPVMASGMATVDGAGEPSGGGGGDGPL